MSELEVTEVVDVNAGFVSLDDELRQPPPLELPQQAIRKVLVVFDFLRGDGHRGTTRVFLNGVADLRTQSDVEKVEHLLMEQGAFSHVTIINWKSLEG